MAIDARRPFVDRPVVDTAAAIAAGTEASQRWGLTISPTPFRVGMNVLLDAGDAVVRVGHTTAPAVAALELHRVLGDSGIPVAEPLSGAGVDIGQFGVTAWAKVKEVRRPVNFAAVGAAIRLLHSIPSDDVPDTYPVPSPRRFPWWDFSTMLQSVPAELDERALSGLRRCVDTNAAYLTQVDSEQVVCHGDLHRTNTLSTTRGPVLLDWDLMCWSHPAWDHAVLLGMVNRWGEPRSTYDAFSRGYGASLADDALTLALAALRDVAATLLLARAVEAGTGNAAELERRLAYWRGDAPDVVFCAQ